MENPVEYIFNIQLRIRVQFWESVCEQIVNFDRIEYPNIIRMQYFIESNI